MTSTTTLDRAGRVLIPKSVRDELSLEPGDSIEITTDGDRVTLRPLRSTSRLRKERGVWVFHSAERLTASETRRVIHEMREKRDSRNSGRLR